jgi:hypothetical protein
MNEDHAPDDVMTCGKGLAHHADAPLKMAEMLSALADTLELHRTMLVLTDPRSKKEDEVYHELAEQFGEVAKKLERAARDMEAQRPLRMGDHDESKWGDAHVDSFTKFVRAQSALAALLAENAPRDEKMLKSMLGG